MIYEDKEKFTVSVQTLLMPMKTEKDLWLKIRFFAPIELRTKFCSIFFRRLLSTFSETFTRVCRIKYYCEKRKNRIFCRIRKIVEFFFLGFLVFFRSKEETSPTKGTSSSHILSDRGRCFQSYSSGPVSSE